MKPSSPADLASTASIASACSRNRALVDLLPALASHPPISAPFPEPEACKRPDFHPHYIRTSPAQTSPTNVGFWEGKWLILGGLSGLVWAGLAQAGRLKILPPQGDAG